MSYARRQHHRYFVRSAGHGLAAAAVVVVALTVSCAGGEAPLVLMLLLFAAGLSLAAVRAKRLGERWGVGADSEQAVQLVLDELTGGGWTVRHGVLWQGPGDVDHLVRSPGGLGFAIETKTLTFSHQHLRRSEATARWAARRFRRYPHGVIPVLCIVRALRIESRCGEVVVVSLDRLLPALERLAVSTQHLGGRDLSPAPFAASGGHDG